MKVSFHVSFRLMTLVIVGLVFISGISLFWFQNRHRNSIDKRERDANALILNWYQLFLEADRYTEGYRGPISARTAAYIAMASYQAALPYSQDHYLSLETLYPVKFAKFDPVYEFHLGAALNACFRTCFEKYFVTAPISIHNKFQQTFISNRNRFLTTASLEQIKHSELFGEEMALAVYDYSAEDSIGHMAYLHLYDPAYVSPKGFGMYAINPKHPLPPLLPHWGNVRPFIIVTEKNLAKPLSDYRYDPSSVFYTEALEILTVSSPLSNENKWIAEFWSDDHPGLTFTPSTRWISIANQVVFEQELETGVLLEFYLKLSFGLADAGIACWNSKYHYNLERPEAFIVNTLNPKWEPLSAAPNFPSYPSGHSIFGAVAAEVLTQFFGKQYEMTDDSHKDRDEFDGKPRFFKSFYAMAFENAYSRISLGVHFRSDCEEGLSMGFKIGKEICKVNLRSKDYSSN